MRLSARYEVLRPLGAGGEARVLLVQDVLRGGALRVLKAVTEPDAAVRLAREYAVLSDLAHPHVGEVLALAHDEAAGLHYLVCPYYAGGDLAAAGADTLPLPRRVALAWQVLRALVYLHDVGVVHGDLKPQNVVLDERGDARLVDFGLVHLLSARPGEKRDDVGGTPAFLAPECLAGGVPSVRADLHALGLLLAWLFGAWRPHRGPVRLGRSGARSDRHPEIARASAPGDLSDEAIGVLARFAAPDPEARPASVREAARLLAAALPEPLGEPLETPATLLARVRAGGLYGRAAAEAWVAERLEQLVVGAPAERLRVVFVGGPPGSGKTALLEAVRRRALLRGCEASDPEPPESTYDLATWLALGEVPGEARPAPAVLPRSPRAARAEWIDRLGARVWAAAADRPHVILVDDVERVDAAVRALVAHLARTAPMATPSARLLVLLAHTGNDGGALERELAPFASVERLTLAPLEPDAVQALVARLSPATPPSPALAAALHVATGGLPALLQGALSLLAARGDLADASTDAGAAVPEIEAGALPRSVEDAARARLRALPEALGRLVRVLALLPHPCPLALLEALPVDGPVGLPCGTLAEALRCGLLREDEGRAGRVVRLLEPALRPVVAGDSETSARAAVARALVDALHGVGGFPPGARGSLFAAAGDASGAFAAAAAAAEEAAAAGSDAEELRWLRRALVWGGERVAAELQLAARERLLALLARLGELDEARRVHDALAESHPGRAAALALHLAAAQLAVGAHREALETVAAHAPEAGEEPDRTVLRAAVVARAQVFLGRQEEARAVASEGLAQAGARSDLRVHLLTSLGLAHTYAGSYDEALRAFEEADGLQRAGAAPEERAFVLNGLGLLLQRRGEFDAARARYAESLAEAHRRGYLDRVAAAALNLGNIAQVASDMAGALARYEEAAGVARRLGDLTLLAKVLTNHGNLEAQLGLVPEAERRLAAARALAVALGNELLLAYVDQVGADAAARRDDEEEAARRRSAARTAFARLGARREVLEVDVLAGRAALGARRFSDAAALGVAIEREAGLIGSTRHAALGAWLQGEAERRRYGGRAEAAVGLLDRALHTLGRDASPDDVWPVAASLARAEAAAGRVLPAAVQAGRAMETVGRILAGLGPAEAAAFRRLPLHAEVLDAVAPLAAAATSRGAGDLGRGRGVEAEILQINKRLLVEPDVDRILETILDVAIALTGAERGFLLLPRESARRGADPFEVRVARNVDRESLTRRALKVSTSIAREVFATGQPLLALDAMNDERLRTHLSIAAMRLRSVLCVPLKHREECLGVVYIDNRFQEGAFDATQQDRLQAFADQAALALANARVVEELRRTNRALQASQREVERLNHELRDDLAHRTEALQVAESRLHEQASALAERFRYGSIVGGGPAMRQLFALLDRVAATTVPVLVTGESGTGKELVARALHFNGPRRTAELVAVNCAALPETLLESELFGYVRGAFTGADRDRAGLFERAHRGTLLLDEVADMSLAMQAKLLRILESGELTRLGDTRSVRVDVRLVAATNADLRGRVEARSFREDLYYRLHVIEVRVPSLRERREDIPALVAHFLERAEPRTGRRLRIAPAALARLVERDWPGNVRELEATVTSLAVLAETGEIGLGDLARVLGDRPGSASPQGPLAWDGVSTLEEVQRAVVRAALVRFHGNKRRAAAALGINRGTLYNVLARACDTIPTPEGESTS